MHSLQVFSAKMLKKLIDHFIPNELVSSDWSCTEADPLANLQSLLKTSNLKMYGGAEDILKYLKTSVNFPGSSEFFGFPETQQFCTSPKAYYSLKGERYIYKHDYFAALEQICRTMDSLEDPLITISLREKEKGLSRNNEMVPLRDEDVEEFRKLIKQFKAEQVNKISTETLNHQKTVDAILKFSSSNHPEFFEANIDLETHQKTLTVRIFQDNKVKYIMAHELLEVMKIGGLDTSKVEMEVEKMGKLGTFDFRQVFEMVGKDMSKIEFIAIPRPPPRHSAVLIPSFNGEGYCLPATDVFLELLKNLFIVKHVVQRYDWQYIQKFFETVVDQFFDSTGYQGIYFIAYEDIKRIHELRDSYFSDRSSTVADFRFYPKNFTVEDLKNEMEHLKLSDVFKEISMEAERLQDDDSYFQSNYMFCAIEMCQLRCFLRRIPKLAQFLHQQKACEVYESPFYCDICKGPENLKDVLPELLSLAGSSSEPVIEKNQKKKKKSKKALVEVQNEKKPEEKESQCCQKCFRTSEICQKAQEDAKASNNKNRKLESQLKITERKLEEAENQNQKMKEDFEKKMEQKDAEIEMLRKLLAASKTQPEESKEPEEEELGDLECLICHDDMDDIKDTLKCQNCCRRYHKNCLVGWFEKSRCCPVCDSEFEEGIEN